GPFGVRSSERFPSTTYAIGIGLAASWDVALAEKVGAGIGKDARARGILTASVSLPKAISIGTQE
ncbi:MAG TPA: hypothetical protein VLA83_14720, partial [Candidatus Binatia bacterium]|nr:hypothetical protein [Candidatus Binatia bacterium]